MDRKQLGFCKCGNNVLISRNAVFYDVENIEIGDNVRIDDFCLLSGKIVLGKNIHIAAFSALYGGTDGIFISDYSNISSRVSIYSKSDDYSGNSMTNPTIPENYKNIYSAPVYINKHVIIGATCVVLPGVVIGEGAAVGSMSFVNKSLPPWGIFAGIPCTFLKNRSKNLLEEEKKLLSDFS